MIRSYNLPDSHHPDILMFNDMTVENRFPRKIFHRDKHGHTSTHFGNDNRVLPCRDGSIEGGVVRIAASYGKYLSGLTC